MAEENKHPPTTEEQTPPEMPGKAPKMEQAEIPDVGGGPAPSAKVIDLSAVRSTPEKDAPTDIPKEPEAQPVSVTEYSKQEWKKPMPEPEKTKPKRGRPAKAEKATPTEPGAKKEVKAEKPRRGRPPKTEKASPEQAKPPKAGKTHAAPEEKAAPPAPEVPPTPRDATRAEKEEIVYLDLSDLHPFKDHPFGVRDDAEMKSLVESVRNGGVNQPALVRPREGGGYEIIAGHRRQMASQLAGYHNMPCIVRNMTDDEAILAMTDDNLRQRETILPSEKAMSLKMQYEAKLSAAVDAAGAEAREARSRYDAAASKVTDKKAMLEAMDNYRKTYPVIKEYRAIRKEKDKQKFYAAHEADFIINDAAKRQLDKLGAPKQLPKRREIVAEIQSLVSQKNECYNDYREKSDRLHELMTMQRNYQMAMPQPKRGHSHEQER